MNIINIYFLISTIVTLLVGIAVLFLVIMIIFKISNNQL